MGNNKTINICPKCKNLMETREHNTLTKNILSKPYYFKIWCYCKKCKHLQHFEKYKVLNK